MGRGYDGMIKYMRSCDGLVRYDHDIVTDGWLVGWLVSWLIGWLIGWLVG